MSIDKKRKGSASKNKGNRWEREICSFLSETFGGSFIRVSNSGAFVGGSNASRKQFLSNGQVRNAKGDIVPPDTLPKMVIEAKNYKEFPFHQLMTPGDCKQLDGWIDQTLDCIDPGDVWFTIFKINNKGAYVCFDNRHIIDFQVGNHVRYKDYIVTEMKDFFTANKEKVEELCR